MIDSCIDCDHVDKPEDVMESLLAGNFYASQGPNMDIEVENNRFTIRADQPALIEFISNGEVVFHEENATYLQGAWQLTEGTQPGFLPRLEISWIKGI